MPYELGKARNKSACSLSGAGHNHPAVAGEHLQFANGLVRQPVSKRAGLDAEPGHGSAESNRLQLRHHQRHQAVGQRGIDETLVRGHALHIRGAGLWVDRQHPVEAGHVQTTALRLAAEAEQVGGAFCQPYRTSGRQPVVCLSQSLNDAGVTRVRRQKICHASHVTTVIAIRLTDHLRGTATPSSTGLVGIQFG